MKFIVNNFMRTHSYLILSLALVMSACVTDKQKRQSDMSKREKKETAERVTGIGGVFFKVKEPKKMAAWYQEHLGIPIKNGYADFTWREKDRPEQIGRTVWSIFPTNSNYFGQSASSLMINYRVSNLNRMLEQLRQSG